MAGTKGHMSYFHHLTSVFKLFTFVFKSAEPNLVGPWVYEIQIYSSRGKDLKGRHDFRPL